MKGKIPYNSLRDICWLHPTGRVDIGNRKIATCPQLIVDEVTVASGTCQTINFSSFGINRIIGAQLTEKDTNEIKNAAQKNQWFKVENNTTIYIYNTTTTTKTYSVLIIAV